MTPEFPYDFLIEFMGNGEVGKAQVRAVDERGKIKDSGYGNLFDQSVRERISKKMAPKLGKTAEDIQKNMEATLFPLMEEMERVRDQDEAQAQARAQTESQANGAPGASGAPYLVHGGRICRRTTLPSGEDYLIPLCNFNARVVWEQILDDDSGVDDFRFGIEGVLDNGMPLPLIVVPATDFDGMHWPIKGWGLRAVVFPTQGTKDHLRAALQLLSRPQTHRIYRHTGWRKLGQDWVYLHAGGAISSQGNLDSLRVELEGKLALYRLPDPPTGQALPLALQAELRLLRGLPARLIYPIMGAVYRSVLDQADCSLALIGPTGLGKSELAALAQQHFGADMHRLNLPGNWTSTANALEALAYLGKNALLTIDDFKPGGSRSEVDGWHSKADRVLRAQGNSSARQRCWADGRLRPERTPRGLILMTGEDQVRCESLRARQLPLLVRPGEFKISDLTPYQQDAAGRYAQVMAGFLCWLASCYDEVRARLAQEHAELRTKMFSEKNHPRTPGIVADFYLGIKYFLDFALASGTITSAERDQMATKGWQALLLAAADQTQEILAQDPVRRFLVLLGSCLSSGRAHLASPQGKEPENAIAWGWRSKPESSRPPATTGNPPPESKIWEPQGRLIGWLKGARVYLDPEAAYAEVESLAEAQGERLPLSQQKLFRRMKDEGLFVKSEPDKCTLRKTLQGRVRAVLCLRPEDLSPSREPGGEEEQEE
jgi:hypothetical protein